MIVLGLILIILAGTALYLVSMETSMTASTASFTVFGYSFQPNHLEMFLVGAATAGVLLLGLALMGSGSRRSSARRRRMREVKGEANDRVTQLETEKRDLERKLEADRTAQVDHDRDQDVVRDHDRDRDRDHDRDRDRTARTDTGPHAVPADPAHDDQLVAGAPSRRRADETGPLHRRPDGDV